MIYLKGFNIEIVPDVSKFQITGDFFIENTTDLERLVEAIKKTFLLYLVGSPNDIQRDAEEMANETCHPIDLCYVPIGSEPIVEPIVFIAGHQHESWDMQEREESELMEAEAIIRETEHNINELEAMTKKQKLIQALERQYQDLPERDIFGNNNHTEQWLIAIEYLKTGKVPEIEEEHNLVRDVVHNIEQVFEDYQIT